MLTQTDIKKLREELKKDFITKKEFKAELISLKKEIQQMFRDFADEITDFMTPSLKKIDDICEELKNHNDDIDNHERRIEKLEDKVFATTTNPL